MTEQRHLGYIDGLRAIAILAVICVHVVVLLPDLGQYAIGHLAFHHGLAPFVVSVFGAGLHGVDLFFVVSGFCLSYPVLTKLQNAGTASFDTRAYVTKRIIRIFPPYAIAVVFSTALYLYLSHHGLPLLTSMDANVGIKDIIKQLFFLDRNTHSLNQVFWTLPVEARWYFMFPAMLAMWLYSKCGFYTVMALTVIAFHTTLASSIDIGQLPAFASGIVAADWFLARRKTARYTLPIGIATALAGMLLQSHVRTSLLWQIAAFCFVVLAGESSRLQRALSPALLRAVGMASYSIYLAHQQVLQLSFRTLVGRYDTPVAMAISVVAGLTAGAIFWYCCERPFTSTRLRDKLIARVNPVVDRVFELLELGGKIAFARLPRVKDIKPHETALNGKWIRVNERTVGDETQCRINYLLKKHLVRVADSLTEGSWVKLYQDPVDRRYWEMTYPHSNLQGGGPQILYVVSLDHIRRVYGLNIES